METQKKKFKMPHTYVILVIVILIMTACTYFIPAGEYDRVEVDGRTVVDASSYHSVENSPVGFFELFKSIPEGYNEACAIIFFIFIIGGSFHIVTSTGAIEKGIGRLAKASQGRERLLIPLITFTFSLAGGTFGMSEEGIVFVPIGVALARAVGFDAIVGMAIVALGIGVGFSSGFMNPFTVGVAQGIAEVPTFSGMPLRLVVWGVMLTVTIFYIMRYAKKIKQNPELSIVRELEEEEKDSHIDLENLGHLTVRDKLILLSLMGTIIILIYGVFNYGWYLTELCALFIILGILSGFIAGFGPSQIAREFVAGAKDMVFGALVVGIARTILVVMTNGMIIDSIVHALASFISILPRGIAAVAMMFVQAVINFFIPSGSGQAAATMPLMTPLCDVIGLTRQTAVLAYQFGDGFTNSIIPTSAVLMGNLSVAKISYDKWLKFIAPLMGIWLAICAVFMMIATIINYGPF